MKDPISFKNLLLGLVTKAVKEAADRLDVNPKVDEFEAFLKKYSAVLHQNHVILIDKKYTLAKMYGRMQGKLEHFIYLILKLRIIKQKMDFVFCFLKKDLGQFRKKI